MQALSQIRQIDYTVIFARNMGEMRLFYETVMEFPLLRTLSDRWIEYRVARRPGAKSPGLVSNDTPPNKRAVLAVAFRAHRKRWPSGGGARAKGLDYLTVTDTIRHRTISSSPAACA